MFSAGNITEKLRVASFDCRGEVVVDLYAGMISSDSVVMVMLKNYDKHYNVSVIHFDHVQFFNTEAFWLGIQPAVREVSLFWVTICKAVRPMLSDHCLSCSVSL